MCICMLDSGLDNGRAGIYKLFEKSDLIQLAHIYSSRVLGSFDTP